MRLAFWITFALAILAALFVLGASGLPLGVPGEWEWGRTAVPEPLWMTIVPLAGAGLLYLGFVALGSGRIERCRALGLSGWLGGLVVAGFAWLWMAQESATENFQLSKTVWVLFFRGSSGYFWEARYEAQDLSEYLRGYAEKMKQGDVLHIGTHPPGLIVLFRGLLAAANRFPELADAALATQPESVRMAFEALEESANPTTRPLSKADRAALWMAALIAQSCAALAVVPLFGLARRTNSRRASWLAAAFWPAVPALALFLPKSDCAFPLIALGTIWLWLKGLDRRDESCETGAEPPRPAADGVDRARPAGGPASLRQRGRLTSSPLFFLLAGFVFWVGLTLSLAFLAIGALLIVTTLVRALASRQPAPADSQMAKASESHLWRLVRSLAIPALWAGAGFAVPTLSVWAAVGLNLPSVWWLNFQNHAGFYAEYPRTWWKWLLVNPLELSLAAGAPLAVVAIWSVARQLHSGGRVARETRPDSPSKKGTVPVGHTDMSRENHSSERDSPLFRHAAKSPGADRSSAVWGWLVTLGLLWLSGKNMGEVARLWIFLMPCLAWFSATVFERVLPGGHAARPAEHFSLANGGWIVALAAQLALCGITVLRVTGFHYPSY